MASLSCIYLNKQLYVSNPGLNYFFWWVRQPLDKIWLISHNHLLHLLFVISPGMQLDCCCIQLKSGAVIRLLPTELLSLLTTQMVRDWRQSKFSSFSDWYKLLCCMPMPPIQGTLSSLKWRKTEHFCFERLLGIKRQFRQTSPARSTDIWKIQPTLLLIISLLDRLLVPEVTNWPNHTLLLTKYLNTSTCAFHFLAGLTAFGFVVALCMLEINVQLFPLNLMCNHKPARTGLGFWATP